MIPKAPKKPVRFVRPEFQEKLDRARGYSRKQTPVPSTLWQRFVYRIGFRSFFTKFLAILLLLLVAYFLAVSHMFLISKANVTGAHIDPGQIKITLDRLEQKRKYLIPENHFLTLNQNILLKALQSEFPQIRQITRFGKLFPDTIELEVEERKPLYVWQNGDAYYFLDQDGVVYQKIGNYTPTTFSQLLIRDKSVETLSAGQQLPIAQLLKFVGQLRSGWKNAISQTDLASFSIPAITSPDAEAKTSTGYTVYFDIERSPQKQLENLSLLLNREIRPETYDGLSYIDLRLPNLAYYCYKDAPCAIENTSQNSDQQQIP